MLEVHEGFVHAELADFVRPGFDFACCVFCLAEPEVEVRSRFDQRGRFACFVDIAADQGCVVIGERLIDRVSKPGRVSKFEGESDA